MRSKKTSLRAIALFFSTFLLVPSSTITFATTVGCLTIPKLQSDQSTATKTLGSGVIAQAWQWSPGDEAIGANLSRLGARVSIATGNLRQIDFGILYSPIPETANLDALVYTNYRAIAAINGDYIDQNGPYSAMIEAEEPLYVPAGYSRVLGMAKVRVNPAKGYRSSGTIQAGTQKFSVTGVNQPYLGLNSAVVYQSNYASKITPKGEATLVFKSGRLYKIFPRGAAITTALGTVMQLTGFQARKVKLLTPRAKVTVSLAKAPKFETRMAVDEVGLSGNISNTNLTFSFDTLNSNQLSPSKASLFDSNFANYTQAGQVTLRILPDDAGRLVVRNVYDHGYFGKVDYGGYLVQANGDSARVALKFKVGDQVTISKSMKSAKNMVFVNAAGRGPQLIGNGKFIWTCRNHSKDYRPRTAIGWNRDGQVWLITTSRGIDAFDDGMRLGGSSSDQVGQWLLSLGATEAYLLDGGGSTTMEVKDRVNGWKRFDLPDSAWFRGLANAFTFQTKN